MFLVAEKQIFTMGLLSNVMLGIKNLSYSDHPRPFPTRLFHFRDSILRKRCKSEMINLKIFIIALFKVSNLETI